MTTRLLLTHQFPRSIAVTRDGGDPVAVIDCAVPRPEIPVAAGSVSRIIALDALEHVLDEEVWLAECARVLRPGGELTLRVPRYGVTSGWDALNIYRYARDITGRGEKPRETSPIGWHRQYRERDLRELLAAAGFSVTATRRHSLGLAELPHLTRLVVGDMFQGDPHTGERAKNARVPLDRLDAHLPAGPLSRRIVMVAKKP